MSTPQAGEDAETYLCAICLERPSGARLRPCGHDHFCSICVLRLFNCPLCRAPLLMENGHVLLASVPIDHAQVAAEVEAVVASRTVVTRQEYIALQGVCFSVWLFIFIFGIVEHMHDIRQSCKGGDPTSDSRLAVVNDSIACQDCSPKNGIDCDMCYPGYYNLGTQCFKYLENLPALRTGAALGGTFYFVLIILTQCTGIVTELVLIWRLVRRKLMPRKELFILGMALFIEITRMFLVDIFVMQEYFGGRSYSIFREPIAVEPGANLNDVGAWQGADSKWYYDDINNYTSDTRYYVAATREAWVADQSMCSTFTTDSALLAFDERGLQDVPGHTRFKTLGWVIGGEFALYYFFATFINELADNMFVIPTTTSSGWLCKIFSVALEVFQLGALCPAAVFAHKNCLHFTDPLGVELHAMSTIVIIFGYLIWGFIFLSLPLAIAGAAMVIGLFLLVSVVAALASCLRSCQCRCCPSRYATIADATATYLEEIRIKFECQLVLLQKSFGAGFEGFRNGTMLMAFLPMLVGGTFLGTLVVVGQASKKGAMQVLTAIVLLSDVLFKIIATIVSELVEYLLHLRVKLNVAKGVNRQVQGRVVGHSIEAWTPDGTRPEQKLDPEYAAGPEVIVSAPTAGGLNLESE